MTANESIFAMLNPPTWRGPSACSSSSGKSWMAAKPIPSAAPTASAAASPAALRGDVRATETKRIAAYGITAYQAYTHTCGHPARKPIATASANTSARDLRPATTCSTASSSIGSHTHAASAGGNHVACPMT
jgi:hypothetical protein